MDKIDITRTADRKTPIVFTARAEKYFREMLPSLAFLDCHVYDRAYREMLHESLANIELRIDEYAEANLGVVDALMLNALNELARTRLEDIVRFQNREEVKDHLYKAIACIMALISKAEERLKG